MKRKLPAQKRIYKRGAVIACTGHGLYTVRFDDNVVEYEMTPAMLVGENSIEGRIAKIELK